MSCSIVGGVSGVGSPLAHYPKLWETWGGRGIWMTPVITLANAQFFGGRSGWANLACERKKK